MTDSNRVQMVSVRETVLGTTPASPRMRKARIRSESISYAPTFVRDEEIRDDRMSGDPIKIGEQNSGGVAVSLSYPVPLSPLSDWMESAMYGPWMNTPSFDNDGVADSVITQVADIGDTFTVASGGDAIVANHLARMSGFGDSANNGLFKVSSSTATTIVVAGTPTLADDASPAAAARIKVVGFEGDSGDVTATADGLGSSTLDFTGLGLAVGQWIKIGGTGSDYRFATEALNGWARITAISANALTLDNRPAGWATDAGAAKTIRVFTGDYIRNGTTQLSLSLERGFLGQTTPTYILHSGMVAGQMNWNITTEQRVDGDFTFTGMSGSQSQVPQDAAPDAVDSSPIMSANVNVGRIAESGSVLAAPNFVRSLSIQLNNNLRAPTAVGSIGAVDIGEGDCAVTGTVETYFGDNTLYAKLLNGTVGSLNTRINKGGQAVTFTLPRVTFNSGAPSAGGRNQDVLLPLGYEASKDTLTSCHLQMDRHEYFEA